MINMDPLLEAYLATEDEGQESFIKWLIQDLEDGLSFPRDFYEFDEALNYCSKRTYDALGKVLQSMDEGIAGRSVDEVVQIKEKKPEVADLPPETLKKVIGPTQKPEKKIRLSRKVGRIALRRMRGLPDVAPPEWVILSSDDEADKVGCSSTCVVDDEERWMNPKVQPSK